MDSSRARVYYDRFSTIAPIWLAVEFTIQYFGPLPPSSSDAEYEVLVAWLPFVAFGLS